jgi:hypothetical protein
LHYKLIAQYQTNQKTFLSSWIRNKTVFISNPFVEAVRNETWSAVTRKMSYRQHYNVASLHGTMIYCVILVNQEQNEHFDNSFGDQTCKMMYTTYAQKATLVSEQSAPQKSMDTYLQK